MLLEDGFRAGPAGDPARVRELVETASRMAALGDRDLALNLLVAAASRCYWGDLRAVGRDVLLAADAIAAASDDQRMLYIQAFAAPIERGEVVLRELDRTEMPEDAAALYPPGHGGMPRRGDSTGRRRCSPRPRGGCARKGACTCSRRSCRSRPGRRSRSATSPSPVPAAEESRGWHPRPERPQWETGAQIAEAKLAALRGDRAAVEELTADADRVALPRGAWPAQPGAVRPRHARTRPRAACRGLRAATPHP